MPVNFIKHDQLNHGNVSRVNDNTNDDNNTNDNNNDDNNNNKGNAYKNELNNLGFASIIFLRLAYSASLRRFSASLFSSSLNIGITVRT